MNIIYKDQYDNTFNPDNAAFYQMGCETGGEYTIYRCYVFSADEIEAQNRKNTAPDNADLSEAVAELGDLIGGIVNG